MPNLKSQASTQMDFDDKKTEEELKFWLPESFGPT
jgi:hypothetical protein